MGGKYEKGRKRKARPCCSPRFKKRRIIKNVNLARKTVQHNGEGEPHKQRRAWPWCERVSHRRGFRHRTADKHTIQAKRGRKLKNERVAQF